MKILVLLFGNVEYDGRVRKIIQIAQRLGSVSLVDTSDRRESGGQMLGVNRSVVLFKSSHGQPLRHLLFLVRAIGAALKLKPDVILAEDFFTPFTGALVARLVGAKLIYDAHELIIPEDGKRHRSRRLNFWYRLERMAVKHAELVIAANPERAKMMQAHYGLARTPIFMRNIPRFPVIDESVKSLARERYPCLKRLSADDKVIIYQGDMSISRGLDRYLDAMNFLPSNIRLVFAGGGPDVERIRVLGRTLEDVGRFAMLGRVPQDILPAVTACADMGLIGYPFYGLNNIYCAPNKIFEYINAGIPVVATNQPPLREIVQKFHLGELIDEKDSGLIIAERVSKVLAMGRISKEKVDLIKTTFTSEIEEGRVFDALQAVVA